MQIEDKKPWMELQVAGLPLVTDLGLFMREGWKRLAGSTQLCFQLRTHRPQLLSAPDASDLRGRSIQRAISWQTAILGQVKWGSSGSSPRDIGGWWGDSISYTGTFQKWGKKAWERPEIADHPTDGDKCLPLAYFSKSQFLINLGFIQRNSELQGGWGWGDSVDRPSFPSLGSRGPRWERTLGPTLVPGDSQHGARSPPTLPFHLVFIYPRQRVKAELPDNQLTHCLGVN